MKTIYALTIIAVGAVATVGSAQAGNSPFWTDSTVPVSSSINR